MSVEFEFKQTNKKTLRYSTKTKQYENNLKCHVHHLFFYIIGGNKFYLIIKSKKKPNSHLHTHKKKRSYTIIIL